MQHETLAYPYTAVKAVTRHRVWICRVGGTETGHSSASSAGASAEDWLDLGIVQRLALRRRPAVSTSSKGRRASLAREADWNVGGAVARWDYVPDRGANRGRQPSLLGGEPRLSSGWRGVHCIAQVRRAHSGNVGLAYRALRAGQRELAVRGVCRPRPLIGVRLRPGNRFASVCGACVLLCLLCAIGDLDPLQ